MGYVTILDLDVLTIWRAIFSIAYIIISFITGIKIMSKFPKTQDKTFLTLGLTWIFLGTIYWGLSFSFISILIFNYQFENELFLFLSYGLIPFIVICWFYSFAKLYNLNKFKQIFYPPLVIFSSFFVLFIVFLLLDSDVYLAKYLGEFQYQRHLFVTSMVGIALILVLFTWLLICIKCIKSRDQIVIWKGRFLFLGLIFMVASLVPELFSSNLLELQILTRVLLMISSVLFYLGFFLPPKLEKMLIKKPSNQS